MTISSTAICAVFFFFALILSGCGKETSAGCADVTCEKGECRRGICINPPSCESDETCLDGYFCNDLLVCEADYPCNEATPCEVGECVYGACLNPAECDANAQCLEGYRCGDEGTCVVSPCAGVVCDRGVCNVDTGICVNEQVCTEETETTACVAGNFCYGLVCESSGAICDDLDCQRGVCDASQKSCANADTCMTDNECVEGAYCDADGACRANQCDVDMTSCDRGVCDPATTDCVNAETCDALEDCTDGFYCVDSACVAIDEACEAGAGCPGNQVCDYDERNLRPFCVENPAGCARALDCDSPRICEDRSCRGPTPCTPDGFEPNDLTAQRTDFNAAATNDALTASLCADDVDVFAFDTRQTPLFLGTLVVDVRTRPADVGIGTIDVKVTSREGDVVGTASGYDPEPVIIDVGAVLAGTFEIEVSSDDMGLAGVDYDLTVRFYEDSTALGCQSPTELTPNDAAYFTSTGLALAFELGSSCTSYDNAAVDRIFSFEITEPSFTQIVVDPAAGVDLSISLREECLAAATELACASRAPTSANETIAAILEPGTYYAIVQPPNSSAGGGNFAISVLTEPTICQPGEASCVSPTQSQSCNPRGTGYDDVTCASGCSASSGLCVRDPSDVCYTAIDANGGYTGTITWNALTNDYDPAPPNCIPRTSNGSESNGPDAAYSVTVGVNEVLVVDVVSNGEPVSIYAVESCGDIANTCVTAANSSTINDEQLIWVNETGTPKDLFVIADVLDDTSIDPGEITIAVDPVICSPSQSRCVGDDRVSCNVQGTAETAESCNFGCLNGTCNGPPNNGCSTPLDLLSLGVYSAPIEAYNNTLSPSSLGCTGSSATGGDAVFDVTGPVGEVVTVEVTAPFDAALYIVTDCSNLTSSCVAGAAEATFGQVEFLVEPGTTYFAVVDSDSGDTGDFTARAISQAPSCTPGTSLGCDGGSGLQYCSPLGVPTVYACDGACLNGACDNPRGLQCIDPVDATDGFTTVNQAFDTPNSYDSGTGARGACTFGSATNGADRVHRVDLVPGDILLATMDSSSSFGTMYLLGDCGDFDTCLANTAPTSGPNHEIRYTATTTESVYLITDRTSSGTSTLDYDLDIRVTRPCVVGQPSYCDVDGQTVVYCDSDALEAYYSCATTCTSGLCDNPAGESCFDPIPITSNGSYTGDFTGINNVEYPIGRSGGCHIDDFDRPDGEEEVYAVELSAGDTVTADLQTTYSSAMLFLMEDCADAGSCRANNPQQGAATLSYTSLSDQTLYIVVDASSASTTATYTLDVQITPGLLCAPSMWACDSSGNAVLCDETGLGFDSYVFCSSSCVGGFCDEDEVNSDLCTTAPDASSGTRIASSFANLTNDISLPTASCVGDDTPGSDYVQSVIVNAGDIIRARVQGYGSEETAVYIFQDCADPAGTCVAGDQGESSEGYFGEVVYQAPATGLYYVAADGTSSFYDEEFSLSIEVLQPECVPGQRQCLDANTLEYCDTNGLFETYPCTNGCTVDACDMPSGDTCLEPEIITASGAYTGDFSGTNAVNYGDTQAGGCFTDAGQAPDGAETVYAIDLNAGETVTADLSTAYTSAYLYISSDCADRNACIINNPERGGATLSYRAPTSERIFLIVDGSSVSTSTYVLDVQITPGLACAPDAWSCDGGNAKLCDSTGSGYAIETVCNNGCSAGYCTPDPAADSCTTAPDATFGVRVVGNFATLTDDITLSSGSCAGDTTPGGDLVYAVAAQPDDIIRARVVGYGGEETAVYIFSDCASAEATCLAGDTGVRIEEFTAEAIYRVTTTGTYYVAADSTASTSDEPFALEIDILAPECTEGSTQCAPDGITLQYCDTNLLLADYTCANGCSAGACNMPSGDTCLEPIPVSSTGTFTGDFGGTNSVDYGSGARGACFTDDFLGNDGGDTVYAVSLGAGETVTANLQTLNSSAYLYVLEECLDPSTCQVNNPGQGPATLSYRAETAETIYVVVDGSTITTTTYTLDLTFNAGYACAPEMWTCDGGDAKLCNSAGSGFDRVTDCPLGCSAGFCELELAADSCGATAANATGLRVQGNFAVPRNDATLSSASCLGTTASAGEYFFALQANAGDVIRASVESYGSETTAVYVFDDCLDAEGSCSVGAQGNSTANYLAEITYQVPTTGTYFVAADATSSASNEPFSFVADVVPGGCAVGATQCNGSILQYCEEGAFVDVACSTTCSTGACDMPAGDVCFDAIPAASTGSYTGTYAAKTNAVNPANGACAFTSANRPDGPETVYAVTLAANDILTATLTTAASGASLYVMSSCTDPTQSCVWAEPDSTSLQYFAQTAGTYYVVVDTDQTTASGTFTLDLSTSSGGVCQPGEVICDAGTGVITECAVDGLSVVSTTTCAETCSPVGFCTGPTVANNTCNDAYFLTAPVSLVDSYSRFTDDLDPTSASACLGESADGPDAVYAITLNANDVLVASVESQNSADDAALYLLSDCSDPVGSCLDGMVSTTETADVVYTSPINQTVYLVVDSDSAFDVDPFLLEVDFGPVECSVGQTQCADANTLEYCNGIGRFETYTCQGGCSNGACGAPSALVCADALAVTSGTSVSDSFKGSNDIDMGTGTVGSCNFSSSSGVGDDHFYAVDMVAGQTLTITYESPGMSGDSASSFGHVFILGDCLDQSTCQANLQTVSANTTGTLTFTATNTQRYFVVVDRALTSSSTITYGYTVDFLIQ